MRKIILASLCLVFTPSFYSQDINTSSYFLNTKNVDFSVKGYYRFMGYNRNLSNLFGNSLNPVVFRADDEFNSPTLNLDMVIKSKESGYIKTQLYLFEPISGNIEDRNFLMLNRKGVSVELGKKTKFGNLKLVAGGINFLRFSDFSLSSAKQVRNSLFDRNAWTAVWPVNVQFNNYFNESNYIRAADWGKRQVSGFNFKATDLPKLYDLEIFYGKTPFNISPVDNIMTFKIGKKQKLNYYSFGLLNSSGVDALINGFEFKNQVFYSTYKGNFNEWKINSEFAVSNYSFQSNGLSESGIAGEITIKPSSRLINFPLFFEGYYISPNFVNIHSSLINGSVQSFSSQTTSFNGEGIPDGARPFGGVMNPMHIKSNNRFGVNINSEFNLGKLKVNLGNGFSREIQNDTNLVSFFHKVNGLYLSRIERFQSSTGPQGNLTTFFRGYYENLLIDDSLNNKINKSFNVLLLNLKYRTKIFNKDFFIFYLGEFHSLQSFLSPIPVFSNNAILRNHFHEFDFYFNINKKMSLIGYYGAELIKGNEFSGLGDVLSENNEYLPRNGIGNVFGLGFDYSISSKSCFYFRFKNVNYNEKNFSNYYYKGYEITAELKIFF